jgi:hypothetical protein
MEIGCILVPNCNFAAVHGSEPIQLRRQLLPGITMRCGSEPHFNRATGELLDYASERIGSHTFQHPRLATSLLSPPC